MVSVGGGRLPLKAVVIDVVVVAVAVVVVVVMVESKSG